MYLSFCAPNPLVDNIAENAWKTKIPTEKCKNGKILLDSRLRCLSVTSRVRFFNPMVPIPRQRLSAGPIQKFLEIRPEKAQRELLSLRKAGLNVRVYYDYIQR